MYPNHQEKLGFKQKIIFINVNLKYLHIATKKLRKINFAS
jgi:hypothetical protein